MFFFNFFVIYVKSYLYSQNFKKICLVILWLTFIAGGTFQVEWIILFWFPRNSFKLLFYYLNFVTKIILKHFDKYKSFHWTGSSTGIKHENKNFQIKENICEETSQGQTGICDHFKKLLDADMKFLIAFFGLWCLFWFANVTVIPTKMFKDDDYDKKSFWRSFLWERDDHGHVSKS